LLDEGNHPHEANYLKLECSKAKTHLNWHPKWHLDEALGKIVAWHKQYQQGVNMKAVTLAQISAYQMNKGDFTCKL
jgi:CDP-glucose 4,6-dehydratase